MNNDREISRKLEEELEGYDEAVVQKIRELSMSTKPSMGRLMDELLVNGECILYEDDYDIPTTD